MASAGKTEDQLGLRPLTTLTVGEHVIDPDAIPWVPYEGLPGIFATRAR